MSEAYIGQIQPFAFNFAPKNWLQCMGQILSIQQNAALFSLLGTQFGGNGVTTFAIPNMQSRVPVHQGTYQGTAFVMGEIGGEENVMLTINNMPSHMHGFLGTSGASNSAFPQDASAMGTITVGTGTPANFYAPSTVPQPLNATSIGMAGGNSPHTNIQPYLAINWCICQYGIFPSRN